MGRLVLIALVLGCGSSNKNRPDAAVDGTFDVAVDAGLGWETVSTVSNDGQVIVEDVAYRVGGLLVRGRVCRPAATGAYPMIMYNHGGFSGYEVDPELARCPMVAQSGYVWMSSEYRGEGGSEGRKEVCLGEVDDVLQMLAIADVQPYVKPDRVLMWGGSHGGCITLRAIERGAPVKAAIDAFGPADIAVVYSFWRSQIAAGSPLSGTYQQLITELDDDIGGPPETHAADYAARSPLNFLGQLPANVPLQILHGAADQLVPVTQSCELAMMIGAQSYHRDSAQAETTAAVPGCSGVTFSATAPANDWTGNRFFVVFDGLDHGFFNNAQSMQMIQDAATFTLAKL